MGGKISSDPLFTAANFNDIVVFVYERGVAQLAARTLWEREAAGSSPATPTCGYGVVVTQNPSKVLSWVRVPLPACEKFCRAYSSTAERAAHNRLVLGSNPSGPNL